MLNVDEMRARGLWSACTSRNNLLLIGKGRHEEFDARTHVCDRQCLLDRLSAERACPSSIEPRASFAAQSAIARISQARKSGACAVN